MIPLIVVFVCTLIALFLFTGITVMNALQTGGVVLVVTLLGLIGVYAGMAYMSYVVLMEALMHFSPRE